MRATVPDLTAVFTAVLLSMTGCSNAGSAASPNAELQSARGFVLPSGLESRFGRVMRVTAVTPPARAATLEHDLFVSNGGSAVVVLANRTYIRLGAITNGINGSDGGWVDNKGNLYVANFNGNVTEYRRGRTGPICTYSSNLNDPIDGVTDNAGNVYVVDIYPGNPGFVYKFAQCSNTITGQYKIGGGGPEGVATDSAGNLFVSFYCNLGGGTGCFEEFKAGHKSPTPLGATVGSSAGIVIDRKGNLIADDQSGFIDVIAPPYRSARVLESGLSIPFHDALNAKEDLLFDAEAGAATVTVYGYPSGKPVVTLGRANGIYEAYGVADSPGATF